MTSCFTSRSIASMRATSKPPRFFTASAGFGDQAELGHGSAACASISNQMRNLVSGSQMRAISGRL